MATKLSGVGSQVRKATSTRGSRDFTEIGRTGLRRFSGMVQEEFLTSLQGQSGVKVYREMADNDPIIGASLYAIEQVIRQADWYVEPHSSSTEDKECADFVGQCIDDMECSWSDFISDVLSFETYGWSYFEQVYKLRKGQTNDPRTNSKYDDGLVGLRKLSIRKQSTLYQWDWNDVGDIIAMQQMAPPDYDIRTIPFDKAILFRTKSDGNNPEGRSLLRSAYRPWYIKKNLETIEAIGVERDLVGLPIFKPPEDFDIEAEENSNVRTYIDKLIGNLRRDEQEGICLPAKWEISLLTIGGSRRQFDTNIIINRYDKRLALTMLAGFIMLGMDRVGSFALGQSQNDLFLTAVQGHLNNIAETLNRYMIPKLLSLNSKFASLVGKAPILCPSKVYSPNLTELAAYLNSLTKIPGLIPITPRLQQELIRRGGFGGPAKNRIGVLYAEDSELDKPIPPPQPQPQPLPTKTEQTAKKPSTNDNATT